MLKGVSVLLFNMLMAHGINVQPRAIFCGVEPCGYVGVGSDTGFVSVLTNIKNNKKF